jgi:hypothetical protein
MAFTHRNGELERFTLEHSIFRGWHWKQTAASTQKSPIALPDRPFCSFGGGVVDIGDFSIRIMPSNLSCKTESAEHDAPDASILQRDIPSPGEIFFELRMDASILLRDR